MKASYSQCPAQLELMPDGYHKFRFEIEEISNGENSQFECREVDIHGAVTSNKVIEAAMTDKWGNGIEQKLINDYNEHQLTGTNETAVQAYTNFLAQRKALKEEVRSVVDGI